jgi:hypothetical protein
MAEQIQLFTRPVDIERFESHIERQKTPLQTSDIGYIYTVLAQCFLPYRDPKVSHWERRNGKYSMILSAGAVHHPNKPGALLELGLPYGPKPRLFLAFINSVAVKRQSPVVPVARSMTGMLRALGFEPRGGPRGTITSFKNQIMKLAACNFTIVGPGPKGGETYTKAPPIKQFSVWIPTQAESPKSNVWPTEIVLTDDYFESLKYHAVPFDFRALGDIQNNARAMDIFFWLTQRLPRLNKPLTMKWADLFELFGGNLDIRNRRLFKQTFRDDALAAKLCYPSARMEETNEGFTFHPSPRLVPRVLITSPGPRQ